MRKRNMLPKSCFAGLTFCGGVASIACSLLTLAGYGGDFLSNKYIRYGDLLIYGGIVLACTGRKALAQELWQRFNNSRILRLRLFLLISVVGVGAFLLYCRIKTYGYDVLPEGISVPIGNATYSALTYGTFFLITVLNVFFLTSLPKEG